MKIRVRGKKIVCIDSRYSINLKTIQVEKTIASFSKFETTSPDRVKNLLTPLEYAELLIFMGNRRVELHQTMLQETAGSIAATKNGPKRVFCIQLPVIKNVECPDH